MIEALLLSASLMLGDVHWSVSYGNGWGPYWRSGYGSRWDWRYGYDWRYRHHWRNDPWFDRYRYDRYRPPRRREPEVRVIAPPQDTTIASEQVERGSRSSLPANARLIQTDQGTLYRWEGSCYRMDWGSQRYLVVDCP
ncbi:hypothetical protein [Ferrimonas marina]|uniref:Uncharacterized protein n=1 Tax=Ferrimonas marina TaxID=299255 RepID=A0A1M5XX49_9GAMM|nr:hypothetical protein [Ferrimonas marina]SHI04269.1 hypothetical protein SAMN02745129_3767 [Ferrimonas marina]